jgi:hypothetical protein
MSTNCIGMIDDDGFVAPSSLLLTASRLSVIRQQIVLEQHTHSHTRHPSVPTHTINHTINTTTSTSNIQHPKTQKPKRPHTHTHNRNTTTPTANISSNYHETKPYLDVSRMDCCDFAGTNVRLCAALDWILLLLVFFRSNNGAITAKASPPSRIFAIITTTNTTCSLHGMGS